MECSKFNEQWISRDQSHKNIASKISLGIVRKPAWLYQHSLYQWNFFFRTDLSRHLAPFHRLQTCLVFLLLLPLVVVYHFNPPTSSPCLFKQMKNDERVAKLFQCLLDHTQEKWYFSLISIMRNIVSNSVLHQFETLCVCVYIYIYIWGEEWLGFPDLWSGQKPWWNWYLTTVVNFGEVWRAQLAKSILLTSLLVPLGSFQIF